MSLKPRTKSFFRRFRVGSVESDTALKLLPALHVAPSILPNMCIQKTSFPCCCACASASFRSLYQWMSEVNSWTLSEQTVPCRTGSALADDESNPMLAARISVADSRIMALVFLTIGCTLAERYSTFTFILCSNCEVKQHNYVLGK